VDSLAEAQRLLGGRGQSAPYEVLLLDRFPLDQWARGFLTTCQQHPQLSRLTLIVLPAEADQLNARSLLPDRAHILSRPLDKAYLFNALHASQQRAQGGTVVSFAEHLERRGAIPATAGLHVLVADDNPTNRLVIKHLLERSGIRCKAVDDGEQAIEALEEDAYDLAILDMHMPVLSGIDAFKLYRFAHAGDARQVPFIMLTANATLEAQAEAQAAGIAHFLTKPISSEQLLKTIVEATRPTQPTAGVAGSHRNEDSECVLDGSQIADLFAYVSTPEFAEQLVGGFEADGRRLLGEMGQAIARGDWGAVRDGAHALRGSAANLGLVSLREQAGRLQHSGDADVRQAGKRRVQDLAAAFETATHALRTEVARHTTAGVGTRGT
jgi:two-component system sensor histidine kinase RpfC